MRLRLSAAGDGSALITAAAIASVVAGPTFVGDLGRGMGQAVAIVSTGLAQMLPGIAQNVARAATAQHSSARCV